MTEVADSVKLFRVVKIMSKLGKNSESKPLESELTAERLFRHM